MYLKPKIHPAFLVLGLLTLVLGTVFVYRTAGVKQSDDYEILYNSALRMQKAERVIADYCLANSIELEEEDINGTYLIGPYYSPLMSTMGYPDLKRTTLDPNAAAVMASYYLEAGLKPGDVLGIGTSGSFPGYAIASLCAATEMGLSAKVIASYGSSMYGATRPELNIVKIIQLLIDSNVIDVELTAVSPGGHADSGVGSLDGFLYDNTRELVLQLAAESEELLIDEGSTAASIKKRLELFGKLDCFVNVGGAGANSGSSSFSLDFPPGLVMHLDNIPKDENRGLVFEYAEQGIPVINILNIKQICSDKGMEFDPSPLPPAGTGGVYYETAYSGLWIVLTLILSFSVLFVGTKFRCSSSKSRKLGNNQE